MIPIIFFYPLRAFPGFSNLLQIEPRTEKVWPGAWMGNCTLHRDVSVITAMAGGPQREQDRQNGVANLRSHPSREGHGSRRPEDSANQLGTQFQLPLSSGGLVTSSPLRPKHATASDILESPVFLLVANHCPVRQGEAVFEAWSLA